MSAVLELIAVAKPAAAPDPSSDWERPSGPVDATTAPRAMAPAFTYRGYADPHLRGQTCHMIGAVKADERTVIMACGCQVSVPWWTLEPRKRIGSA